MIASSKVSTASSFVGFGEGIVLSKNLSLSRTSLKKKQQTYLRKSKPNVLLLQLLRHGLNFSAYGVSTAATGSRRKLEIDEYSHGRMKIKMYVRGSSSLRILCAHLLPA